MPNVALLQADPSVLAPSRFAADRLLRLQDLVHRRNSTERLLYGPDRERLLALLNRAIISTYGDCREAGVEDEALRLLLRSGRAPIPDLPVAA